MTIELEYRARVERMLREYRLTQVLITCVQLGVFQELAAGSQDIQTLAVRTDSAAPALQRLLNAAVALELLQKQEDQYVNGPMADACLATEGPHYLGNVIRREQAFYQRWGHLTEAVRNGQRPNANVRDEESGDWVRDFELALYDRARAAGPAIAATLDLPTDRPLRVLDIGGGHGGYSMALCNHYPNVEAVVFELPAAAAVARDLIAEAGLNSRVHVQEGDFQKEELGNGYDMALLFGILVSERVPEKQKLLHKTFRALSPGGQVVIRGAHLNEDRTAPLDATLFSLHMLLSTDAGDISTLGELQGWLQEAGFTKPRRADLPDWAGNGLLVATRPA